MSRGRKKEAVNSTPYRASEELYQALFEQATDGIFIANAQGRYIEVNQRGCEMLGYTYEEILNLSMEDLIPAEDLARDPLHLDELRGGKTLLEERRLYTKDGRLLPVETSARMLSDGTFLGMVRDISERKRAEELLHKREHEFRTLMENSPDFIGRYDREARAVYVNPALERLFGKPLAQLLGKTSVEITPGVKGAQYFDNKIREVLNTGFPVETEIIVDEIPGQDAFHHHLRFVPERDHVGQVVSVLFIGRDITALKETERQFRALTEHSPDIIARFDQAGRYLYINNAVEKIIGIPVQELLGQPIDKMLSKRLSLVAPEEVQSLRQAIAQVFVTGAATETEIKLSLPAGEHIFNVRLIPEYNQAGQVASVLHISRDITKLKQAAEAQQKSHEELRAFFSQTIDGCFFMMLDEPVRWDGTTDKEVVLDYVFAHQHITQINEAMLAQYGATREQMLKLTPNDFFKHNLVHGRDLWRRLYDAGKIRLESDERKLDGTPMWIEGEYIILYDLEGRITGHFGIQRDITERKQMEEERQAHLHFFESMDQVNRAMQGTNDLEQMMSNVLDTMLSIFDCDRAWLVYPCDPEAIWWRVPMDPEVATVSRILRNSSGPVKFGPRSEHRVPAGVAQGFSVQSFIAMALHPRVGQPWMLGLHQCSYPRDWTPQEERLFQEIGRRLGDALTSLLVYHNLRESERKLEEAQHMAHIGYWDRDYIAGQITLSDEAYRILGVPPEQRSTDLAECDRQWQESIHPEDRQRVLQATTDALRRGPQYDVEYRLVRPDGEMRILHSLGDVTWDKSGRPRHMFGFIQDITELRQAEEILRASEERYRVLYRENPSMFFTLDAEGTVISLNNFGASQLGYTMQELEGQSVLKVFYEDDKATVSEQLKTCLQNPGQVYHWQFRKVRKDGRLMWVEEFVRAVNGPDGVAYVLVVCQDITERKQLEAENEQLAAQFYQAQKMDSIGRLAGGIAHDFNNLLVPIMGYVELGMIDLAPESKLYADLTQIRKAAERAAGLTRQILAFSRQQILQPRVVDLNDIVTNIEKMLQRLIGEDIDLVAMLGQQLGWVKADPGQLEQVIVNLVVNARDAMPEGENLPSKQQTCFWMRFMLKNTQVNWLRATMSC